MDWSPEQDRALEAVSEWLDRGDQPLFRLFGYAGTGKTTLARHFASNLDGSVAFAAFTGKAAHVLRKKGCEGASTIHKLIYRSKDKSQLRLKELESRYVEMSAKVDETMRDVDPDLMQLRREIDVERENLSRPAFSLNYDSDIKFCKLVIIDECSMVDGQMADDLLWFGVPILVLGDPAQLPPVQGTGFFVNGRPDFMLTEIHRQARENPIIRMASSVRQEGRLELGDYGSSRVIELSGVNKELVLDADQLLVGRNTTRRDYNARYREILGRSSWAPETGDRLICLRNNHDKGLLNGQQWQAGEVLSYDDNQVSLNIQPVEDDGSVSQSVDCHAHHFLGREEKMTWWERREAEEFDYGYAITVHKAQGSQWDDVVLFDESWCFRADKFKWLYTGLTRAAERVTVVKM